MKNNIFELTEKEKEILTAICRDGIINYNDLAKHFVISVTTVKTHVGNIFLKLQVNSKAELMYKYYANLIKENLRLRKHIKKLANFAKSLNDATSNNN